MPKGYPCIEIHSLPNEWFINEYETLHKTIRQISKDSKIPVVAIRKKLVEIGLKIRRENPRCKIKVGDKIGNRLVIKKLPNTKNGSTRWLVRCSCGMENECGGKDLSMSKSCINCCHNIFSKHHQWKGYEEISRTYWNSIVSNAEYRNLEFTITIEEGWTLFLKQNRTCALTNLKIQFREANQRWESKNQTASLDRIDCNRGYLIDNVQWVHKDLNRMRLNFPLDKFINYCRLVVANQPLLYNGT